MQTFIKKSIYYNNPTNIFSNICKLKPATLLLESAEIKNKKKIKSMIIARSALKITALYRTVTIKPITLNGQHFLSFLITLLPKKIKINFSLDCVKLRFPKINYQIDEDSKLSSLSVFEVLRIILKSTNSIKTVNKKNNFFLGGFFSYDLISNFEILPKIISKQNCPDFCFYLSENLIILNHKKETCFIQSNIFTENIRERNRILLESENINKKLMNLPKQKRNEKKFSTKITCNMTDKEYCVKIKKVQSYIKKGEIFQTVPSRRFFIDCPYPLNAYHILKKTNPSPYMFYMQDHAFILFGASPESSLKFDPITRKIEIHPIAGTRKRGINKKKELDYDLDNKIELEMRTNKKELSEHIMLVDLARNDLSKICDPGTRYVADLLRVDKYKYVMHLVSRVVGKLKTHLDCLHAYQSCMNMGTLTGAPKVRAMQIISSLEKEKRGTYGGAIGYLTSSGKIDTCIIIRSAYVEKNIATVQSGAGIVIDSIPFEESEESKNKAKSVLRAIQSANLLLDDF